MVQYVTHMIMGAECESVPEPTSKPKPTLGKPKTTTHGSKTENPHISRKTINIHVYGKDRSRKARSRSPRWRRRSPIVWFCPYSDFCEELTMGSFFSSYHGTELYMYLPVHLLYRIVQGYDTR